MMRLQRICLLVLVLVSLLTASTGAAFGQSLSEVRQAWENAKASNLSVASADASVLSWLQQNDLQSVTDIGDVAWLSRWLLSEGQPSNQFSVTWTGTLQVPASGKYSFSTCPMNMNINEGETRTRQTMGVWIGNQQVLDTTQGDWTWQGTPIALEAGSKTPIRVEYSYLTTGDRGTEQAATAMLFWEGPGVTRGLVPSTALTAGSGAAGLNAKYLFTVDGKQQAASLVDAKIDHCWVKDDPIVPIDGPAWQRVAARLAAMVVDATYLDACEKGACVPIVEEMRVLDSVQRQALLQVVLARPKMVSRMKPKAVALMFGCCRAADPDGALDLLGRFMQLIPDGLANMKDELHRMAFWQLGKLIWQQPEEFARLERLYLVMADGKCCLPVAYILAFGYAQENRLGEWTQKLQARLDDTSLQGDPRVNWLVARAMAEELQWSPSQRAHFSQGHLLRGRTWLEEACLVAQSDATRFRAYQQLTARLATTEDIDGANKLLDKVATRLSDPTATAALAGWRTQVTAMADKFRQQHQDQEALAKKAYLDSLQAKRQQAIDQHDDESSAHYQRLLDAADTQAN